MKILIDEMDDGWDEKLKELMQWKKIENELEIYFQI